MPDGRYLKIYTPKPPNSWTDSMLLIPPMISVHPRETVLKNLAAIAEAT